MHGLIYRNTAKGFKRTDLKLVNHVKAGRDNINDVNQHGYFVLFFFIDAYNDSTCNT